MFGFTHPPCYKLYPGLPSLVMLTSWCKWWPVSTRKFQLAINKIMSAISEYAAAQAAFNARIETSVAGITADVTSLNDKITELQNSPGRITPEDQALLDGLQAQGAALAAKLEALDAIVTVPPPAPPEAPTTLSY